MDLEGLRAQLLDAREARTSLIASLGLPNLAVVFVSLNVPGADKDGPRFDRVFTRGREAVLEALPASSLAIEGRDALGPYALVRSAASELDSKRTCIRIEESLPFGRLLDIDVVDSKGRQVSRASLGLSPRLCMVCDNPAVDCIRTQRHTEEELAEAVRSLSWPPVTALAGALVDGARIELDLTPKPGLVDRRDNGSHPDLSYESMSRSIDLLPLYYEDLTGLAKAVPLDLATCAAAGRRAEDRMVAAVGNNTHRGYIFLSGLLLLAYAIDRSHTVAGWRRETVAISKRLLCGSDGLPSASHGAAARQRHGVLGVHGEALAGLPSVFDCGLPALRLGLTRLSSREAAGYYLMANLMGKVEDTTALHRCGPEGLARLRRDAARLTALMLDGGNYRAALSTLNDEYRETRLTMGGVADCMALTFALEAEDLA